MMHALITFIHMGGYGGYVWSAYIIAFTYLGIQWFIPWRRWKKYTRRKVANSDNATHSVVLNRSSLQ